MNIPFEYNGRNILLTYNERGILEHVTDTDTDRKLVMQFTQVGKGFEFTTNNGYVAMDMCNAVYIRIMELDVFVPKFIFIPNSDEHYCSCEKPWGVSGKCVNCGKPIKIH